jgi:hypothetical protein
MKWTSNYVVLSTVHDCKEQKSKGAELVLDLQSTTIEFP